MFMHDKYVINMLTMHIKYANMHIICYTTFLMSMYLIFFVIILVHCTSRCNIIMSIFLNLKLLISGVVCKN